MNNGDTYLRSVLFTRAEARLKAQADARGVLLGSVMSGHRPGVLDFIQDADLGTVVISITTDGARAKLREYSANEYWLLYLVCTAAVESASLPLTEESIDAARQELLRIYPNQALLARVQTGMFHDLSSEDMALATADGIIVTDETWPFPNDQQRINPLYI